MECYGVGLDLGQKKDFTAMAVVQRVERRGAFDAMMHAYRKETKLVVRTVKRVPLGTPYTEVVRRARETVRHPDVMGRVMLAVDATGVGTGVVEMLKEAGLGCRMLPAMITGGERETEEGGFYRVPKRDLMMGLQLLLERGDLQIAAEIEQGPALMREMTEMRVKVTAGGREQFGTWREGTHDDMVFAVALAPGG